MPLALADLPKALQESSCQQANKAIKSYAWQSQEESHQTVWLQIRFDLWISLQKINQIKSLTATVYRRCLMISEVGHTACLPSDSVESGTRAEETQKVRAISCIFSIHSKVYLEWLEKPWMKKIFLIIKEFTLLSWARQHQGIIMGSYFLLPCKIFTNCSTSKL